MCHRVIYPDFSSVSWLLGDGWQHPSLLRHESVDSGVARGGQGGLGGGTGGTGGPWGPEGPLPGRHPKRNGRDKERERHGVIHQRNGNFHPHKGDERRENKLKFVEEDFVSFFSSLFVLELPPTVSTFN